MHTALKTEEIYHLTGFVRIPLNSKVFFLAFAFVNNFDWLQNEAYQRES